MYCTRCIIDSWMKPLEKDLVEGHGHDSYWKDGHTHSMAQHFVNILQWLRWMAKSQGLNFSSNWILLRLYFPREHFQHSGLQVQWWYFVGLGPHMSGQPFCLGRSLECMRLCTHPLGKQHSLIHSYISHYDIMDLLSNLETPGEMMMVFVCFSMQLMFHSCSII